MKYVVSHFGRRDGYQVAEALHRVDRLGSLVTDGYVGPVLAAVADRLGAPAPLSRRAAESVPLTRVRQVTASRLARRPPAERDEKLGVHAARVAAQHGWGTLTYHYHWKGVVGSGVERGPAIVFQVHPIAAQIREQLAMMRSREGVTGSPEPEELVSEEETEAEVRRLCRADRIIAASRFTADGLIAAGVPRDMVSIVPYGGSPDPAFADRETYASRPARSGRPLRLIFVGQLTYRKGLTTLFRALDQIPPGSVDVTILTRSKVPSWLEPLPARVIVKRGLDDAEVRRELTQSDLFVLPSFVEGYGLVLLEALLSGIPILASDATAGRDLGGPAIDVVPAGDVDAWAQAITALVDDRERLERMRDGVRSATYDLSWQDFRKGIVTAVNRVEGDRG